ncbi:hypothetical protein HK105_205190 [Polyrhizophydium stewartii]|uniref:Tetraspanin n=1 Tax=Polyrhizophydium stewartii TaxID=2732419 RepID=A0ABR4N715_9FUNG
MQHQQFQQPPYADPAVHPLYVPVGPADLDQAAPGAPYPPAGHGRPVAQPPARAPHGQSHHQVGDVAVLRPDSRGGARPASPSPNPLLRLPSSPSSANASAGRVPSRRQPKPDADDPELPLPLPAPSRTSSGSRHFSLSRSLSRFSKRSFVSNMSSLNRNNLGRFGRSKITLVVANTLFWLTGIGAFLFALFTVIEAFSVAPLFKVWGTTVLIILAITGAVQLVLGAIGYVGVFLHRKALLFLVMLMIWPLIAGYLYTGYTTYKTLHTSQWETVLSTNWDTYSDAYGCCGFLSEFDRPSPIGACSGFANGNTTSAFKETQFEKRQTQPDATVPTQQGQTPVVPGCHDAWSSFSAQYLRITYIISFSIVPFAFIMFIILILGTNHLYMD